MYSATPCMKKAPYTKMIMKRHRVAHSSGTSEPSSDSSMSRSSRKVRKTRMMRKDRRTRSTRKTRRRERFTCEKFWSRSMNTSIQPLRTTRLSSVFHLQSGPAKNISSSATRRTKSSAVNINAKAMSTAIIHTGASAMELSNRPVSLAELQYSNARLMKSSAVIATNTAFSVMAAVIAEATCGLETIRAAHSPQRPGKRLRVRKARKRCSRPPKPTLAATA
mmetsp:Transcript_96793/g.312586  ORF Transcript_96793/g.312586 Transcript_96793/m.312586 type:complete len:221 (+) Transcript_96793:779-1441(+)